MYIVQMFSPCLWFLLLHETTNTYGYMVLNLNRGQSTAYLSCLKPDQPGFSYIIVACVGGQYSNSSTLLKAQVGARLPFILIGLAFIASY